MSQRTLIVATCILMLTLLGTPAQADKPVMAVADFYNEVTGVYWWSGGVARDLAGMLTNELAATGAFSMVERSRVDTVLAEQNLAAAGRTSPETGAKIGQMTGAQYTVLATVTAFEQSSRSGGGIGVKGLRLGGKKDKTYLAVDLRVVDSTKGTVEYVRTVEARAGGKGFSVSGYESGLSGSLATESKTPAGKAIRAVVVEIADYLECAMVRQDGCMAEFDAKEEQRREGLKDTVKLD